MAGSNLSEQQKVKKYQTIKEKIKQVSNYAVKAIDEVLKVRKENENYIGGEKEKYNRDPSEGWVDKNKEEKKKYIIHLQAAKKKMENADKEYQNLLNIFNIMFAARISVTEKIKTLAQNNHHAGSNLSKRELQDQLQHYQDILKLTEDKALTEYINQKINEKKNDKNDKKSISIPETALDVLEASKKLINEKIAKLEELKKQLPIVNNNQEDPNQAIHVEENLLEVMPSLLNISYQNNNPNILQEADPAIQASILKGIENSKKTSNFTYKWFEEHFESIIFLSCITSITICVTIKLIKKKIQKARKFKRVLSEISSKELEDQA